MDKISSKNRDFILEFNKMTLSSMCKDCNISRSQLYNNELPSEKEKKLKEYIVIKFINLYASYFN